MLSLLAAIPMIGPATPAPSALDKVDVIWTTPSEDAAGSMPIGNGEVVLNAWVESGTGDILFYISRTDSLSEVSRILKLGRVRVHFSPNPFQGDFRQHLHLRDGCIQFASKDIDLKLFIDSNSDVIHLTGDSREPIRASIRMECWRNQPFTIPKDQMGSAWSARDAPFPLVESADQFVDAPDSVTWYHRNETSVVPALWKEQSLENLSGRWDPLLHRTLGGRIMGNGFSKLGERDLVANALKHLDVRIAAISAQTSTVDQWLTHVQSELEKSPTEKAWQRTLAWWSTFWNQSWVFVDTPKDPETGKLITRGYTLQRYVQACQGRGTYPIKFNGGYYTVEPKAAGLPYNADFRNWGDSEWYQNLRHTVAPMLAQGDVDMMDPFFRFFEEAVPLCKARAKFYYNADGVYFPETMTDYGTYAGGDYGWDRKGLTPGDVQCPWWANARNQGLELVQQMLDRWDYTGDKKFLTKQLLPMADEVLRWFDTRYKKNADGEIILDPTQAVETYWTGVVNDMPTVAGLIAVTSRLTSLPSDLVPHDLAEFFEKMKAACPALPLQKAPSDEQELAPAQKYEDKTSNCENPELYAVWPFRVVDLGHPALLAQARLAYENRKNHLDVGWGYDGNVAALLGLTDEAARILVVKCQNSHEGYRWPATWGPNFDWLPDQNHGGNLLNTCNLMLLQGGYEGEPLRLLPAWPKDWNVDFKLHGPDKRVVRVIYRDGRFVEKQVTKAPLH